MLTDPPITTAQAERVADRVAATGREPTAVYVTHGHGDHWFGTAALLRRFPAATGTATEGVIAQMRRASPEAPAGRARCSRCVPGADPGHPGGRPPCPRAGSSSMGRCCGIEVGHSDTDDSTMLHVPSIDLIVAGDVIYNNVHQFLAESAGGGWRRGCGPSTRSRPCAGPVVAGHKDDRWPTTR